MHAKCQKSYYLNRVRVHNKETLLEHYRKQGRQPLITVCNHYSCVDDPFLWGGLLDLVDLRAKFRSLRYALAAHDVCFTNALHRKSLRDVVFPWVRWFYFCNLICVNIKKVNIFFSLGQCVPVVRGDGVYQYAMDYCIELLKAKRWVHMYPEGKVNVPRKPMRIKWGVGRLLSECDDFLPTVLPFFHIGMHHVYPNGRTHYVPNVAKRVTILVGQPLDYSDLLKSLNARNASSRETRKALTDLIQKELYALEPKAKLLHQNWLSENR